MRKYITIFILLFCISVSNLKANETLYLGGDSIGIVAEYNGVYVNGIYSIKSNEKNYTNNLIKTNDLIIEINTIPIHNIKEFNQIINTFTNTVNEIPIKLIRDNKFLNVKLNVIIENGISKHGLYLKDKIYGIGTLTYIDLDTGTYGALAHPIADSNNEYIQSGSIYNASITSINKSNNEYTGEKIGSIQYDQIVGNIESNISNGIYGNLYNKDVKDRLKVESVNINEIKNGEAWLYTTVSDNKIEKFKISITKINHSKTDKSLEFKIIDQDLINKCGGIVHGMSGSPIIQDGKLVGAVTHVLVNDPTKGYGIFIENMLEVAE